MPRNVAEQPKADEALGILSHIQQMIVERGASNAVVQQLRRIETRLAEGDIPGQSEISAQFSLYPLRVASLTPAISAALETLSDFGLNTTLGPMSTLVIGQSDEVWQALSAVFSSACKHHKVVMNVTFSNACPKTQK